MDRCDALERKDRAEVGHAFAEALIPSIPSGIDKFIILCKTYLAPIPTDNKTILLCEPDVQRGGLSASILATYGLTPTHIVLAADAIALWVERAIDARFFTTKNIIIRYNNDLVAITDTRNRSKFTIYDVVSEISAFAEIAPITSEVLFHWLIDIAEFLPYIFVGFSATKTGNGKILLKRLPENQAPKNLFTRWSKPTS